MNFKILNTIGGQFADKAKQDLQMLGETDYEILSQSKFQEIIGRYDIVIMGLGLNINKEVIDAAVNLKIIATATTGLDHINVPYAKEQGIEIISLKDDLEFMKKISGTAELAWGLLLALVRKIPSAYDSVKRGEWKREDYKGNSLYGKTLGILGLGRLGSLMVDYGKAFCMNVIFADPNVSSFEGAKKVSFHELLETSDALSIHVHLSHETEGMISGKELSLMKKSAVIINTSRGKVVDEEALLRALKEKIIAGYAADVLSDELEFGEKILQDNALVAYAKENSNLIILPHIGGMTYESRILTDLRIAEKLVEFCKNLR